MFRKTEVRIMDDDTIIDVKDIGDSTNKVAFPFEYGEGLIGSTVMIQKVGEPAFTWLQLAEVEIYGIPLKPSSSPSLSQTRQLSTSPSSQPTISSKPSLSSQPSTEFEIPIT